MAKQVVMGAMLRCSEGLSPTTLIVIPHTVSAGYPPAANIQDYKPIVNIPTFGMCNSKSNPAVIAATAAAQGTHTPAPCVPATTSPWSSGSPTVKIDQQKALTDDCTCDCMWNGTIEVSQPGQQTVKIES